MIIVTSEESTSSHNPLGVKKTLKHVEIIKV